MTFISLLHFDYVNYSLYLLSESAMNQSYWNSIEKLKSWHIIYVMNG